MPPAVGCPVTYLNDMGGSSRAALAVRPGAAGIAFAELARQRLGRVAAAGQLRADARRNREQVLRTARQLFATEGLGVSLDEIARRAGVGPGTVHRHFPAKEALYLAVATDMLKQLVAEAEVLAATGDPAALFSLLSRMMATGAENVAVKSALAAAEFDLRTAAPVSRPTSRAMSRTCWTARMPPVLRAAMSPLTR